MLLPLSQSDIDVILFALPLVLLDTETTYSQKVLDNEFIDSISHKFMETSEPLTPPELSLIFYAVGLALDILSGGDPSISLSDLSKDYQSNLIRYRFPLIKLYGLLEPVVESFKVFLHFFSILRTLPYD